MCILFVYYFYSIIAINFNRSIQNVTVSMILFSENCRALNEF